MDDLTRVEFTRNDEEFTLLAHVRGWCHNGQACAICRAEFRAHSAEMVLETIICG